jgi:hypothetical protein
MAKRKAIDWQAIQQEWDAGQLDIREIARQNGITHQAILNRANRKGWPPRPEKIPVVADLVTKQTRDSELVTNPRIALTAFHRAIALLLRHRKMMGALNDEIERCLNDVAIYRQRVAEQERAFRLEEIEQMMNIVAKAAQAMGKLVPLERRAFGFTDNDGPSEFDGLTPEEMDAVDATFRKAIGLPPEPKE